MSISFNYLKISPASPPPAPSRPELSYLTSTSVDNATAITTPTTFSSINLGAEHPNRYIVVVGHIFANGTSGSISGITIGGSSATEVVQATNAGTTCSTGIWVIYLPTGTSADIVLSVSEGTESRGIAVYRMLSTAGATVNSTNTSVSNLTDGKSATVNVSSVGVVIAGSTTVNGVDPSWTNVTKQYTMDIRSGEWASGGMNTTTSDGVLNVSSSNCRSLAMACFL